MRGSILDNIVIPVIIFVFVLGLLVAYVVYDEFNKQLSTIAPFMAQHEAMKSIPKVMSIFDYGVLTMVVLFGITSIALASRIKTHPVFFVLSFIIFLISVFLAWMYTDIFEMITQQSIFDVAIAYLNTTVEIMLQYSIIFAVIGMLILIAMYIKLYEVYTYG